MTSHDNNPWRGYITTSMLWGNTEFCVKLSGED